jgi:hypothetical protein
MTSGSRSIASNSARAGASGVLPVALFTAQRLRALGRIARVRGGQALVRHLLQMTEPAIDIADELRVPRLCWWVGV